MARKRLLERIKDEIAKEGLVARTNAARKWLKEKVKEVRMPGGAKHAFVNASSKSMGMSAFRNEVKNGKVNLYFYFYDPKTKDTLPYYDIFPLIIPLGLYNDGFLGLNLHYIHPKYRLILLDKLQTTLTDTRFDENTRMRMSYDVIKNSSRLFEAKPCIKRYLTTHVKSNFLELTADEWDMAVLLPFEQFKKQSQVRVWADSRKKF